MALRTDDLDHLLSLVQDGVVSRRQLIELGGGDHDVARMLRRRELRTVHPGVFVNHTGELTWEQRAWAAVHAHWPAALARESALPSPPASVHAPVHVAIDARRTTKPVPGVIAHRCAHLEARVDWHRAPPRVRLAETCVDLLVALPVADAFAAVAAACHSRQTGVAEIRAVLAGRLRVPRRHLLEELLADLETGATSVLEREYLVAVERAHGLPGPARQPRVVGASGRATYRDVDYGDLDLVVELDGRAHHDGARQWDASHDRDLEAALDGRRTIRLTYGQVFRAPCLTAARVGVLLRQGGWTGEVLRCPRCPDS